MARVPQLSSLSADDYPDAPEWFRQFLETLNPFVGDTTQALSGGLNKDNIARQYETLTIETRAFAADTFANGAVQIKNRLSTKPTAVIVCQVYPQANIDLAQGTPHYPGAANEPAFQNTWSNLGGQTPAAFYKDGSGLVHLEGVVTGGTVASGATGAVYTLPVSYRPATTVVFACASNNAFGRGSVEPDGTVQAVIGSNVYFNLADCKPFRSVEGSATGSVGAPIWDYTQAGNVRISYIPGLRPNTKYAITVAIE